MGVKKETTSLSVLPSSIFTSAFSYAVLLLILGRLPLIPSTTFCPYATWSHRKK